MSAAELSIELPAWERAIDVAAATYRHGDTIPRAWLDQQFGIEWPEMMSRAQAQRINLRFFSAMVSFSEGLLHRHKMALRADNRGGWLIVPPGQQHLLAIERLSRDVSRALRKAGDVIDHTRTESLSDEEAKARRAARAKIAAFASMSAQRLTDRVPTALPPGEGQE